jgi:hypothetical protein
MPQEPSELSRPLIDREFTLVQNVAELCASFYGDARINDPWPESSEGPRDQRRRLCIEAARALTDEEMLRDLYGEEGFDWFSVVDEIVDGLYEGLSPADAVASALCEEPSAHIRDDEGSSHDGD